MERKIRGRPNRLRRQSRQRLRQLRDQVGNDAAPSPESTESPEAISLQLLADEEEAIVDPVLISLEQVNDLEDDRGILAEELIPGLLYLLRRKARNPLDEPRGHTHRDAPLPLWSHSAPAVCDARGSPAILGCSAEDPWLCAPAFRQVCPFSFSLCYQSSDRTDTP